MEKEVVAAIVGAISGLASGLVATWATMKAKRVDRVIEDMKLWVGAYESKLLENRLQDYRKLWKLTQPHITASYRRT